MEETGESNRVQMRKGVLEYSILLILNSNDEYSSSIIQKLKDVDIIVAEGTVYPLLARLKNSGMLTYRWEESLQGPPRKYYTITEQGKKQLAGLDCMWNDMAASINKLKTASNHQAG